MAKVDCFYKDSVAKEATYWRLPQLSPVFKPFFTATFDLFDSKLLVVAHRRYLLMSFAQALVLKHHMRLSSTHFLASGSCAPGHACKSSDHAHSCYSRQLKAIVTEDLNLHFARQILNRLHSYLC